MSKAVLLAGLFLFVNIVLKLIFADNTSFSYDEIISVKNCDLPFGHIKHEAEWDNNPPFFYYCLWIWHKLFSVSEFASRSLTVLFSAFAIALTVLFAYRHSSLFASACVGICLTASNFLTFYALETRAYSLVFLLSILSAIQYFRAVDQPRNARFIWLALINFLIIYSHYIAFLSIFFQFIHCLVSTRKIVRGML